jgi:hypothetical protein
MSEEEVERRKITPTSADEVFDFSGKACNVILYSDFGRYTNLDQVLSPYGACIFLYLNKENMGHWCCIFKYPNKRGYEVFDSYGIIPDDELKWTSKQFRLDHGQYYPQLTYLLYNENEPIEYNNYKFQGKHSATCGLWCALRIKHKDMDLDKFKYYFKDLPESCGVAPDNFISYLFS